MTISVRQVPLPTRPFSVLAVVVLALCGLILTAPSARADPVGDIYSVASTKKAAEFIQEHAGQVSAGTIGAGAAAGFCGPLAPGCGAIVAMVSGSYSAYSGIVNNAARNNQCLALYFGDTISGNVNALPYARGYTGPGCRQSGAPVDLDDDLTDAVLNGGGG